LVAEVCTRVRSGALGRMAVRLTEVHVVMHVRRVPMRVSVAVQALIEGDPESERSEKYQQHAAHPLTGPLDEHWYLPPEEDDERGPCQQEQRVPDGKAHGDAHRMRARSSAIRRPH